MLGPLRFSTSSADNYSSDVEVLPELTELSVFELPLFLLSQAVIVPEASASDSANAAKRSNLFFIKHFPFYYSGPLPFGNKI